MGEPTVWQAIPIPLAQAAATVRGEPSPSGRTGSGRDKEQRLIPARRGSWCQPHPPPPPDAACSRLVVPKMWRAIP